MTSPYEMFAPDMSSLLSADLGRKDGAALNINEWMKMRDAQVAAQFKPISDWIKVFDNIQIDPQLASQFTEHHKPIDDWQALKQQVEYWQTLKQQIARRAQEYQKEFNDITQARFELDKQRSVDATLERACIPPDMIYKANQPWTSPPIPPTKKEGDPDGALVPLPKKEVPERAPLNYPQHDFVAAMYKPWTPLV